MNRKRTASRRSASQPRVSGKGHAIRFRLATLIFVMVACCTYLTVAHYLGRDTIDHFDRRIRQSIRGSWTLDAIPLICFSIAIVLSFPAGCFAYRRGPKWAVRGLLVLMPINFFGIIFAISRDSRPLSDTELHYSTADQVLCVASLFLSLTLPLLGSHGWKLANRSSR